jgi:hypothetical protein
MFLNNIMMLPSAFLVTLRWTKIYGLPRWMAHTSFTPLWGGYFFLVAPHAAVLVLLPPLVWVWFQQPGGACDGNHFTRQPFLWRNAE